MAKKKETNGEETVAGYYRKIFEAEPKLLKGRSNDELLQRWLKDHPGEKDVPKNVKTGLANIKSVMRKKGRKAGRRQVAAAAGGREQESISAHGFTSTRAHGFGSAKKGEKALERLEEQIDDCLTAAKQIDREGLAQVISLLRSARNAVVWKMGQ